MAAPATELARTVLGRNLRLRSGESLLIETWAHSLPYLPAFVEEARRIGAQPTVLYEDESAWWTAVARRTYAPFRHLSSAEKNALLGADAYLFFWGPAGMQKANALPGGVGDKMTAFNEEWYATARRSGLRGCRMTLGLASDATAEHFGLSAENWRERLIEAGTADARRMQAQGERIARRLQSGSELRIRHPNGTDLRLALRGVHSRVDAGLPGPPGRGRPYAMMANNPSGQVLAAIDHAEASGSITGNRAVYNFSSYERTADCSWTFADGRLTERSLGVGREAFEKAFAGAPKGRDQASFVSIGLNPLAQDVPPCEDTEAGAVMVGIGANAGFGGRVRIPFVGHVLLAGGEIMIDGSAIARDGRVL